jgi:hypothetical protein
MDQNNLVLVMTIFVVLAAIAMIAQAISLVGMLLAVQKIRAKIFAVWPDIESVIRTSKQTVESSSRQIEKISSASAAIVDLTKQRALKVDDLLGDATTRAKVQMERAEMVLDDTMTRVQQTVSIVQSGVIRPIREVHGIISGIRTAIAYLGRSGRPTVDHATSDEEMFI